MALVAQHRVSSACALLLLLVAATALLTSCIAAEADHSVPAYEVETDDYAEAQLGYDGENYDEALSEYYDYYDAEHTEGAVTAEGGAGEAEVLDQLASAMLLSGAGGSGWGNGGAEGDADEQDDTDRDVAAQRQARLSRATRALYTGGEDKLREAVEGLTQLYGELQALLPPTPPQRKRLGAGTAVGGGEAAGQQQRGSPLPDVKTPRSAFPLADGGVWPGPLPGRAPLADAAFMVGALAASGLAAPMLPRNESAAVKALHAAALAGSREAALALADRYYRGRGVAESFEEATRRAQGVAAALVDEAEVAFSYSIPSEPVWLRDRWRGAGYMEAGVEDWELQQEVDYDVELAMRGEPEARRRLGYRRLVGAGLQRDAAGAAEDFEAAAAGGDLAALYHLAFMHMRGIAMPRNYTIALDLFEQAAHSGVEGAYNGLGTMAFNGWGGPRDHAAAVRYFESGAELEDPDCTFNLGTMYAGGHGVAQNYTTAAEYYNDALQLGQWRAPLALATLYGRGWGVERNASSSEQLMRLFLQERSHFSIALRDAVTALDSGDEWTALVHYALLAEQGCVPAVANLAWLAAAGDRFPRPSRFSAALELHVRAAELGCVEGWVDAGNLVWQGEAHGLAGGSNYSRAIGYYELAAERGETEAMCNLGWAHWRGQGVEADVTAARRWYRRAAATAPTIAHKVPPLLALAYLAIVQAATGAATALLGGAVGGDGGAASGGEAGAGDVGGAARDGGSGWRRGGVDRDTAALTLLAVLLAAVLWRRQRLQQRPGGGASHGVGRAAGRGAGHQQLGNAAGSEGQGQRNERGARPASPQVQASD